MPTVKNSADKDQIAKAEEREDLDRHNELQDLKAVLAQGAGRRAIWRILCRCGMFKSSFTSHNSQTVFNEGMRNVGLFLVAEVNEADPTAYLKMMEEARDLELKRDAADNVEKESTQ